MVNEQVIERLVQDNWAITCTTKQQVDLVLHAYENAEIKWRTGDIATQFIPHESRPICIVYCKYNNYIFYDNGRYEKYYEEHGYENITDWFFDAIKNNDSKLIPKLTPQNAEQEHLVQILLAMMQKIPVEVNISGEWELSVILFPTMNYEYRIKPTLIATPLPISREMWSYIDKRWRFIAIDKSGTMYLFLDKPTARDGIWLPVGGVYSQCPLNINTDGINWETSLTERPEGV